MKKPKIIFKVLKEDTGYSALASVKNNFIATEAETIDELRSNVLEAVSLAFEDKGFEYTLDEIRLDYDLESFFHFYKVINAKALSERIGMNQSL